MKPYDIIRQYAILVRIEKERQRSAWDAGLMALANQNFLSGVRLGHTEYLI